MKKFLKFGAVGIVNTLITIGSFTLFVYLGVNYILANFMAYILGMINSFFLNKNWVFQTKTNHISIVIKFIFVNLITLGINTLFLYVLVQFIHLHASVAQLISTSFGLVINYVLNKKWTFNL